MTCRWVSQGLPNYGHGACTVTDGMLVCEDCGLTMPISCRPYGPQLSEFETLSKQHMHLKQSFLSVSVHAQKLSHETKHLKLLLSSQQKHFDKLLSDEKEEIVRLKKMLRSTKEDLLDQRKENERERAHFEKQCEAQLKNERIVSLERERDLMKQKQLEDTIQDLKEQLKTTKTRQRPPPILPVSKKKKKQTVEKMYTEWDLLDEVGKQTKCYIDIAKTATDDSKKLVAKVAADKKIITTLKDQVKQWKKKFAQLNDTNDVVISYSNMTTMFCMFARVLKSTKYWHEQLALHLGTGEWGNERHSVIVGFKEIVSEIRKRVFSKSGKTVTFTELCEEMQLWVIRTVFLRRQACRRIQRYWRRYEQKKL